MRAGRSNADLNAAMIQGFQDAKKYVKVLNTSVFHQQ